MKKSDSKYTKTHDKKREAKQKLFKFYLDDKEEAEAYEMLIESSNAKKLVIDALLAYKNS